MNAPTFADLLKAFYDGQDGLLDVRALPDIKHEFISPTDLDALRQFARTYRDRNLYFGVALRKDASSGEAANCISLPAAFTDIDFKDIDETTARESLDRFPLPPSCIIHSGGGLHCYWLLKEALDLTTETARADAKILLRRLAAQFHGDMAAAEPARILRIPGSMNYKPEHSQPRRVVIEALDPARRYHTSELDDHLPTVARTDPPRQEEGDGTIGAGKRNHHLTSLAGSMRRRGMSPDAMLAALQVENRTRCRPPLDDEEVRRIVASVGKYQPAEGEPTRAPVITFLSSVQPEQVDWIWPGRIARGKYTLLSGEPGLGKTFAMLDVNARVSRGATFPDGAMAPLGRVLKLTAEDGLADTIRPRIDDLGGDPSQIAVLEAVKEADGTRSAVSLVRDLAMVAEAAREVQPVIVDIDPLNAYMGGTDTHRDSEVRAALAPLLDMAAVMRFALVGIGHLSKDAQKAALHRPGGSIAFVAAARVVLGLVADQQDPGRRLLVPLKSNICKPAPTLAFRIGDDGLAWEADAVADVDVEALFRPTHPGDKEEYSGAEQIVVDLLANEAWPIEAKVAIEAGQAHGLHERTMRRAARKLGIRIEKSGGRGAPWLWNRPSNSNRTQSGQPSLEHPDVSPLSPLKNIEQKEEEAQKSVQRGHTVGAIGDDPETVGDEWEDIA